MLQILVAPGVAESQTRQAALLTAVNTGVRAFGGGAHVKMAEDFELLTPWDRGRGAKEVLSEFHITDFANVTFVEELDPASPVVVIGGADWEGELPLYPTWEGWAAGVVTDPGQRLAEEAEFVLAGVMSAAQAVSEAFQSARGNTVAAARSFGVSLWKPGIDWRDPDAVGPPLAYLPDNFWLLGLGHLGQACAWALGFLPFASGKRKNVRVMLQDFDDIVLANEATSMLVRRGERGLKTRLVERELEKLGLTVLRTDRRFDGNTRRDAGPPPEPCLALAGFDKVEPRRLLQDAGFSYVVDLGIGAGPGEYLGISVHTFPSSRTPREVFAAASSATVDGEELMEKAAYAAAIEDAVKRREAGSREAARCGLVEVAGAAVGAAFVGTAAATLAVSEILRIVNDGDQYETMSLHLRSPDQLACYRNPEQKPIYPGFVAAEPARTPDIQYTPD